MPNVMLEILNTFLIKGVDIYFGHKDKVYDALPSHGGETHLRVSQSQVAES
jgi:hypothetical protein